MEFRFISDDGKTLTFDIPNGTNTHLSSTMKSNVTEKPVIYDEEKNTVDIYLDDSELRNWIKLARKERHWTQKDLSAYAQTSLAYVSQFERGFLTPSPKTIGSIIAALLFWYDSPSGDTSRTLYQSEETNNFDEKIIYEMIGNLLAQNDKDTIELLKTTLVSIAKVQNEINKETSYESSIDMLINIAAVDFQKGLSNLKK